MRSGVTLFFGIFSVMALSNAIVPVLPSFSDRPVWTGAVYSAYFLGAFLSTLPAGFLSDRFGRVALMRTGLLVTVVSGAALCLSGSELTAVLARFAEGLGAGLFVAPAMAAINRGEDHEKMSGYFLALLNAGLVIGLITAGLLAAYSSYPVAGILLFTVLAIIPAFTSLIIRETGMIRSDNDIAQSWTIFKQYRGVLYSSVVLIGATGVAISLYPKYSSLPPDAVGFWIAGMSIATIVSVLAISRFPFDDFRMIQVSSLLMAAGILLTAISPAGLLVIGAVAGFVMIAQMNILSDVREHQGTAMGLFSTASYLGMALLPFLAGIITDLSGIAAAFGVTAVIACSVLAVIHRK